MSSQSLHLATDRPLQGPVQGLARHLKVGWEFSDDDCPGPDEQGWRIISVYYEVWKPAGLDLEIRIPTSLADYPRLPLADLCASLADLPDVRLINRVSLVDWPHPQQYRSNLDNPDGMSRLLVEDEGVGDVFLYQPSDREETFRALALSFCRLLAEKFPREFDCFRLWCLEHPFPALNDHVNAPLQAWCSIGVNLLVNKSFQDGFLTLAINPVCTAILGTVLEATLDAVPSELKSPRAEHFEDTALLIRRFFKPVALECLNEAEPSEAARACLELLNR